MGSQDPRGDVFIFMDAFYFHFYCKLFLCNPWILSRDDFFLDIYSFNGRQNEGQTSRKNTGAITGKSKTSICIACLVSDVKYVGNNSQFFFLPNP